MNQQVRGIWLLSGIKFLRSHYPAEMGEHLLGALPGGLRSSISELQPASWYPRSYHVGLLKVITSSHRDEQSARDSLLAYGDMIAGDMTSGAWRPLVPILTPRLFAKKLPDMWLDNHQGYGTLESDIAEIDASRLPLHFSGIQEYDGIGIATLGWIRGWLGKIGLKDVTLTQTGWSLQQSAPNEMICEARWS
jgi:hypothetical protein